MGSRYLDASSKARRVMADGVEVEPAPGAPEPG
jgi:hypothetical protein